MGIELRAAFEFSGLTKDETNQLVGVIKEIEFRELTMVGTLEMGSGIIKAAADALYDKDFDALAEEFMERQDVLRSVRRISVFVTADNMEAAEERLRVVYRRLNATPGYGCDIVKQYIVLRLK